MAEKGKKVVEEKTEFGVDGAGGVKGDEAKLKLVDNIINTPDDQLSSMTSLQPNLVVPLSMMEMYDELFGILLEDIERYAKWQKKRQSYIKERENAKRKITIEELKEVEPSEEPAGEKRGVLRRIFGRRWQAGPIQRREMVEVEQGVIAWGPTPSVEEIEQEELRDTLTKTLLTRVFRLSLYKHRRSVGGIHKMATVDLAKEEMAMQGAGDEPGSDWDEP